MNNVDTSAVWEGVLRALAADIGNDNVELWLKPVEALRLEKQQFYIKVPNKFFTEWIKDHYQDKIEANLKSLLGKNIGLDYEVVKDLNTILPKADPIEHARPQSAFTLSELNPRYTFKAFVVGASNRFAHATAEAIAKKPGTTFNPFFIYGGVGLGKTHLMHAIGHLMRQLVPQAQVLYTTSEEFVNEYIDSLRDNQPAAFRNKYRNLDCLLIDDIQFLIGKGRSEEEFFYTFNALFDSRKQIVIASDRAPKEMAPSELRLISRLEWGVVSDIKAPDLETRIAILRKKAETDKLFIPDDVILYIASVIKINIRALEGALIRLTAFAAMTGSPLSVDAAKELLRDAVDVQPTTSVRLDTILREICDKYALSVTQVKSRSRTNEIAFPRQLGMYLACMMTGLSTTDIGKAFGGRDHTTVIHAREKIKKMLEVDPFFVENVNKLTEHIRAVENQ